jgi:hypothetical protein
MKNGGWLDSYADGGTMQEHQENYNDNSVSLPEGFVGEGYNTKGRDYSPAWGGQFQMGGSIPGAVGFSYARTQSPAPSNGPYAKKTKASAQDGKLIYGSPEYKKAYDENRVAYYDEDSDTYINQELAPIEVAGRAKEKGFWQKYADKIVEENRGASPLEAAIGVPISAVASLPQMAATYAFTGEAERPSEAMNIENPYLALGADVALDPLNFIGTGVLTKEKALSKLAGVNKITSNAAKTLPKIKTFAKGAVSDIEATSNQIRNINSHIKTTRPYIDESLAHVNDVRRVPEHMSTVTTRDDLTHQFDYLMNDLRSIYESSAAYRSSPHKIDKVIGDWQNSTFDKLGRENFYRNNPNINDPAHIQNLYTKILDNLPNPKDIEKFSKSELKSARTKQIFDPSIDVEKIKTFAKSIGKKSDDVASQVTIDPKEQETINAVRELGKYNTMLNSDMKGALSHKKTLQNLNDLILKLDDDVVETIVGIPKAELLNRYKNVVPAETRAATKDLLSNPISTNELRSVPSQYTVMDPAIAKLNTSYDNSSLFSKLGKRYYEINSPYNIEELSSAPESMIKYARTDKYLKPIRDWENNIIGYEDDVFTSGNTTGQLRDALKTVEAAPKGQNFVGSSSLSTDSYPLTLESGMFMVKKGIIEPKFSGDFTGLNRMGTTDMLPKLSLKEINSKIQELEKLSGKKIPRAKIVNGEYKVPEIYFTKLKRGGVIKDDLGQWAHPGEITEIGSNQITMQGVPYPVLGVSNTGDVQMMYPEEEYEFDGEKVTEFPMAKNGIRQEQKGLVNLDQLTNFTNYNTKQPGGWLDKY